MSDWTTHSLPTPEEKRAFVDFVNQLLADDPVVGPRLPINTENDDFYTAISDGLILCKMLNRCVRGCMDEKKLTIKENLNQFEKGINQELFLATCREVGIKVVSVDTANLIAGKPHLVLGLVWQVIKKGMFSQVFLNHSELVMLLLPGEKASNLHSMSEEEVVLRWVNFHLKNSGSELRMSNFSNDVKDGLLYCELMAALGLLPDLEGARRLAPEGRASAVLDAAKAAKASKFVTAKDIVAGNQRLNFAFVANLFCTDPRMPSLPEEYLKVAADASESASSSQSLLAENLKLKAENERLRQALAVSEAENENLKKRLETEKVVVEKGVSDGESARGKPERGEKGEAASVAAATDDENDGEKSEREIHLEKALRAMENEVEQLRQVLKLKIQETEQASADAAQSRDAAAKLQQTYSQVSSRLDEVRKQLDEKEQETQTALLKAKDAQTALSELSSRAVKEGYLRKQGRGFKSWKRRFFSLRDSLLFYFADESAAKAKKPLGVVYLDEYRIGTNPKPDEQPLMMMLEHKSISPPEKGAQFFMEASDAAEMSSWLTVIQRSMSMK